MADHLRVLRPADGLFAFYDGRVEGQSFAPEPNWVDDGALSLGIASYAVVSGGDALVYDTHVSVEHGRRIRAELERAGARRFTVVLSHWHLDHVAGTAAFAGSEVVACERTAALLREHRAEIETGTLSGPPPIDPLVLPTTTFAGRLELAVGATRVELRHTNIHSDDATVLWWPERGLLLCGDTLEDTVTYVDAPHDLPQHRANLDDLRRLAPAAILPNHGAPEVIAAGGYSSGLIDATGRYIDLLLRARDDGAAARRTLAELMPELGPDCRYFAPYEEVHRRNVEAVLAAGP